MAKAVIQDVVDIGFRAEQFGTPADFAAPGGYVERVLDDAATWAEGEVGAAAYAAATGLGALRLKKAELCFVRAELWSRRAGFIDSNSQQALENGAYLNRREYEEQAAKARECMAYWIEEFLTDGRADEVGSALTAGVVETGRLPVRGEVLP